MIKLLIVRRNGAGFASDDVNRREHGDVMIAHNITSLKIVTSQFDAYDFD